MERGDNVIRQESDLSLHDNRTAGGEGHIYGEENPGYRMIQEGRADHNEAYRHFLLDYSAVLSATGLPEIY